MPNGKWWEPGIKERATTAYRLPTDLAWRAREWFGPAWDLFWRSFLAAAPSREPREGWIPSGISERVTAPETWKLEELPAGYYPEGWGPAPTVPTSLQQAIKAFGEKHAGMETVKLPPQPKPPPAGASLAEQEVYRLRLQEYKQAVFWQGLPPAFFDEKGNELSREEAINVMRHYENKQVYKAYAIGGGETVTIGMPLGEALTGIPRILPDGSKENKKAWEAYQTAIKALGTQALNVQPTEEEVQTGDAWKTLSQWPPPTTPMPEVPFKLQGPENWIDRWFWNKKQKALRTPQHLGPMIGSVGPGGEPLGYLGPNQGEAFYGGVVYNPADIGLTGGMWDYPGVYASASTAESGGGGMWAPSAEQAAAGITGISPEWGGGGTQTIPPRAPPTPKWMPQYVPGQTGELKKGLPIGWNAFFASPEHQAMLQGYAKWGKVLDLYEMQKMIPTRTPTRARWA